jgi:hypothetical protein
MIKKILFAAVLIGLISCDKTLSEKEKIEYTTKGKEIAQASFNALSEKLIEQMQQGGTQKAIPFCNVEALPITKELSKKYNAEIKRTSNKLRNLANKPSERELEIIQKYENEIVKNMENFPVVELNEKNQINFYAPIKIKANCLVCHGKVEESVTIKTDSIIKSLYPNDEAIGYNEGDLRGIWSITFKN